MLTTSRIALLHLLLTALLLSAQLAYGVHDVESLADDHAHSSECVVCLSKHSTEADIPASLFISATLQTVMVCEIKPVQYLPVHCRLSAIRAPPASL